MIEIVALIYKSTDYLDLIHTQLYNNCNNFPFRIVGNDPTDKVEKSLKARNVHHDIYHDTKPNDYYLNRVYRCWNYCVTSSKYDDVCLVNSDMVFSDGWLDALIKAHNSGFLPTSRLVESGKLVSGTHAISRDFGRHANNINYEGWNRYASQIKTEQWHPGGLFMPVIFNRQQFIDAGMYPEGNIYSDGIGTTNGQVTESGDAYFFRKFCEKTGRNHVTCFDSLVYHIQEGEKDA